MFEIVYSPRWFFGGDLIVDIISVLVLLLICLTSFKAYRLSKRPMYGVMTTGFALIGVAFLFRVLTNFTVFYEVMVTRQVGFATLTYMTYHASDLLFFLGFFLHRTFMLIGLYLVYSVYHRQPRSNIILITFLLLATTYFSRYAYYLFHGTSFLLLSLLTYEYLRKRRHGKHRTTMVVGYSFGVLALSQALFMFITANRLLYAAGEFLQLIGFILLMGALIKVWKHGKKTRPRRDHR